MVDSKKKSAIDGRVTDDALEIVFERMGQNSAKENPDSRRVVELLREETLKFRDKIKKESNYVLTVGDSRAALDLLDAWMNNQAEPEGVSDEQRSLAKVLLEKLSRFE